VSMDRVKLQYQVSPVYLTGGIAGGMGGGYMPMLSLTDSAAFGNNILGTAGYSLDDAFGTWQVAAGGTLLEQNVGQYPFANLTVAGNAIITNPLNLSMIMLTPMRGANAWEVKKSTMQSLVSTLKQHCNSGGTFMVDTPSYVYTDMILLNITDVSMAMNALPQNAWRFDFHKPLISMSDAATTYGNLLSKMQNGQSTPAPGNGGGSGPQTGVDTSYPVTESGAPTPSTSYYTGPVTSNSGGANTPSVNSPGPDSSAISPNSSPDGSVVTAPGFYPAIPF
jgi:hypothetical protein